MSGAFNSSCPWGSSVDAGEVSIREGLQEKQLDASFS